MPSRWLHDALLTSERWNDLGHAAQNLYVRLVLVVDDFGACDGRDNVIATACYPTHRVDVSETLAQLHAADLIVRYSNAGKPYLALMRWQNDIRGKRRFPAPPICNESLEHLIGLRGKYGRDIGWRNPAGSDGTSILLDQQMRPIIPQPNEWRLVHKAYAPDLDGMQSLRTAGAQPLQTSLPPLVRKPLTLDVELELELDKKTKTKTSTPTRDEAPHGAQPLQTQSTPTAPSNGKIKLNGEGGWDGLSEAQALRWQDMFADVSIPDQLARAAAWLHAHPAERAVIERDDGEESFIVRWLLREVRPGHEPYKGEH